MPQQYYDPWAKVGEAASNAVFKGLASRPNPREQALFDAKIQAARADANKTGLESQRIGNQLSAPGNMQSILSDIYAQIAGTEESPRPSPSMVGPQPPQQVMTAPSQEVIQQRYQENLPQIMSNAMQFAGDKPADLGKIYQAFAPALGASPQQVDNAQMGAGMKYGDTREGMMREPFTLSPGSQRFDGGGNPIASAPFKPAGSAGSFSTTLPDGTVIEYGGATSPTMNKLQEQQIGAAKMRGLLDYTRSLALKDPTNFGFPGFVKGTVQDVTALTSGIAQSMGYTDINDARSTAQRDIARSGVDPSLLSGVFDPNLPAIQTAADLLVYQAASALAGQSGRSVSDRDVQMFKGIVGDPQNVFSNQEKFLSKLSVIENILSIQENVNDTAAGGNVTGSASGQPDRAAKLKRLEELRALKRQRDGGQ